MMGAEPGRPNELSPITRIDTARVRPVQSAAGRSFIEPGSPWQNPEYGGSPAGNGHATARVLEAVAALVESGSLNPFVMKVFPFDEAADALALVEAGHAQGKVVLEIS